MGALGQVGPMWPGVYGRRLCDEVPPGSGHRSPQGQVNKRHAHVFRNRAGDLPKNHPSGFPQLGNLWYLQLTVPGQVIPYPQRVGES